MDDKNIFYVYEWIRLDTNEPFYVGKGKQDRWRCTNNRNAYFLHIVNLCDVAVNILHENISEQEANEYECWYINEYKCIYGYDLANFTDGGEGVSGYKPPEHVIKRNRMRVHGFDIEDYANAIIDMYKNKQMSTYQIAEYYKVSDVCISRVLKKFHVLLKSKKDYRSRNIGINHYEAKSVLVKDVNNNIVNCFETFKRCAKWLVDIGVIDAITGGTKAIRTNIDKNKGYKGLFFYSIDHEKCSKLIKEQLFRNFIVDDIINSDSKAKVIEVYNKNMDLVHIYSSLVLCARWLIDIGISVSFSSARDAIYRNSKPNKFYKYQLNFKIYDKNDYNEKKLK